MRLLSLDLNLSHPPPPPPLLRPSICKMLKQALTRALLEPLFNAQYLFTVFALLIVVVAFCSRMLQQLFHYVILVNLFLFFSRKFTII